MFDAICKHSNAPSKVFSILAFQRLNEADLEAFRQHLYCPECGGKAYYRKASVDGSAACFGSRYHDEDCKEFHPSAMKEKEQRDAEEINQIVRGTDAMMIDFNPIIKRPNKPNASTSTREQPMGSTPDGSPEPSNQSKITEKRQHPQQTTIASQGLDKLLNSLLRGSELAQSDLWIYTDEKYRWRAKNLFVNFADAEPTENGSPRMYWGTISHADKTMNWLNPADCKDMGIPIDGIRDKLFQRFSIQEHRDLEGAGMIVFGQCFWNKEKSRKIIKIWGNDNPRIFIAKAAED